MSDLEPRSIESQASLSTAELAACHWLMAWCHRHSNDSDAWELTNQAANTWFDEVFAGWSCNWQPMPPSAPGQLLSLEDRSILVGALRDGGSPIYLQVELDDVTHIINFHLVDKQQSIVPSKAVKFQDDDLGYDKMAAAVAHRDHRDLIRRARYNSDLLVYLLRQAIYTWCASGGGCDTAYEGPSAASMLKDNEPWLASESMVIYTAMFELLPLQRCGPAARPGGMMALPQEGENRIKCGADDVDIPFTESQLSSEAHELLGPLLGTLREGRDS